MDLLEKITNKLNQLLLFLGGILFCSMIVLTCANILFRQIAVPIQGTYELMGYAGAVVTAFALAHTQLTKGHIAVDILVNTFSKPLRRAVDLFNYSVCLIFFGLTSWQLILKALILMRSSEVSETLRIIYYPFTLACAAGCALMSLALLVDFLKTVFPAKEGTS
jgi:TRAP-type C4-dicarboxylate transport system permease small subunit